VINGFITVITLNKIKNLSNRLSQVVNPSLQALDDFKKMMIESKMYTTNWVFLRSKQEDKDLLKKLHDSDYKALKARINSYTGQWKNKNWVDSLDKVYAGFEQLLAIEKDIMGSLKVFEDYDDPVIKLEAESKVEEQILPRTAALMNSLSVINSFGRAIREQENSNLEQASMKLRTFIIILALTIICIGLFLSFYMTRIIITPINKIKHIVNDLGKGIIRRLSHNGNRDEIGQMIHSVNSLSENLLRTATFAHAIGLRNFDMPFQPLSNEDSLGKALITMRDNLKASERGLIESTADLIQRNKDLEQFTYIVSHNLRAPVANIMGLAYVLNGMGKDMERMQKESLLEELSGAVKKLDNIIIDLNLILQVRRQKNEEKEWISFSSLVSDIKLRLLEIIESEKVIIQSDFSEIDDMFTIKNYLYGIFYNLITKSIKYRQPGIFPIIEIKSRKHGDKIQLLFKDNGRGIDLKKYGKELFGLYKHFDPTVEGKGMGLFIVKTKVASLGGQITVESELNKGTEFKIEFSVEKPS
jgi:signal transduction histidine kinase